MIDKEKLEKIFQNFKFKSKILDLRKVGYLQDVIIKNDEVGCIINVTEENAEFIQQISNSLKSTLSAIEGVKKANIVFTGVTAPKESNAKKIEIPGVKRLILVSSGKGGVGKSTIAFLLSLFLAKKGFKTGILDADIYGPSLPALTNRYEKPEIVDGKMIPYIFEGVKVNSIGYLIPEGKALVWRGPMITKALHQLLSSTDWGDLDFLIVDMPPGTGDIHLTICEKYSIDSVYMVSTPQELSIVDVSRAVDMYKKLGVEISGIIQNMSFFQDSSGEKHYLFGKEDLLKEYSAKNNIQIIAQVPIEQDLLSNAFNNLKIQESFDSILKSIQQN